MCKCTWRFRLAHAALIVFMAIFIDGTALAQDYLSAARGNASPATAPVDASDGTTFSIVKQVDEVNLLFTVTDSKKHLLSGLSAADLLLYDNHQPPEKIRYFQQQSSLPLHVAVLIDTSSSIQEQFGFEKKAATVFSRR